MKDNNEIQKEYWEEAIDKRYANDLDEGERNILKVYIYLIVNRRIIAERSRLQEEVKKLQTYECDDYHGLINPDDVLSLLSFKEE